MQRRQFIGSAAAALCAAGTRRVRAGTGLRLLILGGTQFIGVHMTALALKRGYRVTLFNRGKTNPKLFPHVEKLRGDRNGQLDALRGHSWDAVIDDSGYVPRQVRLSAELLAPHVQRYVYISSISAYASFAQPNDESSPLAPLTRGESIEKLTGPNYGPLKALCEQAVAVAMPHRNIVLRPGFVVGPDDPTDRFTYWPARAARGGAMLVPGVSAQPIQFIDARDLARFTLDAIERDLTGTFNMVTPPGRYTMGQLVGASIHAAEALARPKPAPRAVWVSVDFLQREKADLDEFPIWIAPLGDTAAFPEVSAARALQAGLKITPIATTVRDTLAWYLHRPASERTPLKAGPAPAEERRLLAAWAAHGKTDG
ncbi:MAG TPA: NAD-dependent epimerase/dehydratase family protein [Steroidobacteraceae bacterium]|nr:NAD-dependent epimerase/dehydratase family protein [Steroidobacteraceae bacterium]